jgi:transposase
MVVICAQKEQLVTEPLSLLHPLSLQIVEFLEDDHDLQFKVEFPVPEFCTACGAIGQSIRFSKKLTKYVDLPIRGKRTVLWGMRRRYKCKTCSKVFSPALLDFDEKHRMTKRCHAYVIKHAMTSTNSAVARDLGVDESVVRRALRDYCAEQEAGYRPMLPRVLGIDELLVGGEYRCVLINLEETTIIDVLPNRKKIVIHNYISSMRGRDRVQIVCQDMFHPYKDVSLELFPNATVIVDKFHVVRYANDAMDQIRKRIKRGLTAPQKRTLKGDRKLMLMRRRDLDVWAHLKIKTWFDQFPELGTAYNLKEGFYNIWNSKTHHAARQAYDDWRQRIPAEQEKDWKVVTTMMANWGEYIFNYFKFIPQRYTNALTESINRYLRDVNRNARGLSFEMFRAKIMFTLEHKVKPPETKRLAPFLAREIMAVEPIEDELVDYGVPIFSILQLYSEPETGAFQEEG